VQLSGAAGNVANIITLDSPGIFGGGFDGIKNPPFYYPSLPVCVKELDQNSELLWTLNSDYTKQKYPFNVLTLVAGLDMLGQTYTETSADSRLVECGPDGRVISGSQSAWAVVPDRNHVGTATIDNKDHPSFKLIKQFLTLGASSFTESPNGKPCFTFVFNTQFDVLANLSYPQVILSSGKKISVSEMVKNMYTTGGTKYAYTILAPADEPTGTMKIYWDANHYATATLTQSQSAIRKEVIDNTPAPTPLPLPTPTQLTLTASASAVKPNVAITFGGAFTASGAGVQGALIQLQRSTDSGATWADVAGKTATTGAGGAYSIPYNGEPADGQYQYRTSVAGGTINGITYTAITSNTAPVAVPVTPLACVAAVGAAAVVWAYVRRRR